MKVLVSSWGSSEDQALLVAPTPWRRDGGPPFGARPNPAPWELHYSTSPSFQPPQHPKSRKVTCHAQHTEPRGLIEHVILQGCGNTTHGQHDPGHKGTNSSSPHWCREGDTGYSGSRDLPQDTGQWKPIPDTGRDSPKVLTTSAPRKQAHCRTCSHAWGRAFCLWPSTSCTSEWSNWD